MRSSARRASAVLIVSAAIAALVAGCSTMPAPSGAPAPPSAVAPTPDGSPGSPGPSAEPTPAPAPAFDPAAAADDNRPLVDAALAPLVAAGGIPAGRAVADALVAAGVPVDTIEVTADRTAIGLAVDALLVGVRSGESCVLAQFDDRGFTSTTAAVLSTGACLVGATASLD